MLRNVVVVTCFVVVASYSFIEKRAYRECLDERRSQHHQFTKDDVKDCTIVARNAGDADRLALDYFVGLGDYKNGIETLSDALLSKVAPCAKHSDDILSKWTNMYEARRNHEVIITRASTQIWDDHVGALEFSAIVDDADLNQLEAAELVLQRRSPIDISETFGRYHTAAFLETRNASDVRIHTGVQTACSSTQAELMVLDLDAFVLRNVMLDETTTAIKMKVNVHPRRQYIDAKSSLKKIRVAVVTQAIGLILHVRHDGETSSHLVNALTDFIPSREFDEISDASSQVSATMGRQRGRSELLSTNEILGRRRRDANPTDPAASAAATGRRGRTCRRIGYQFDRQLYRDMRIFRPAWDSHYFDIGLCVGRCSFPLTEDPTDHAIVLARVGQNLCCTPSEYHDRLHITIYHPIHHPNPRQTVLNRYKAKSCSCR